MIFLVHGCDRYFFVSFAFYVYNFFLWFMFVFNAEFMLVFYFSKRFVLIVVDVYCLYFIFYL